MAPAWAARDRALREKIRRQVDPEGLLPERVVGPMIDSGVKEHYARLAFEKSKRAQPPGSLPPHRAARK
jgi:hypothetical protein